jgi:hypothetical protein
VTPWPRLLVVLAMIAACRAEPSSGVKVTVHAFAGDAPATGATVVTHRATGEVIEVLAADAVGDARISSEDGALVTLLMSDAGQPLAIITAPAPPALAELTVHGPPRIDHTPPVPAGQLGFQPTGGIAADHYVVDLGCVQLQLASLAQTIEVAGRCLGSDTYLDVLVRAYAGASLLRYLAGHVALDQGSATLTGDWQTATTPVPILLDGVAPTLTWTLWADGLPFASQPIVDPAPLWNGLAVDATTVRAAISARVTTRDLPAVPTALAFSPTDFLPTVAPALALDPTTLAASWTAANPGADVLDLHATWTVAGAAITWDVLLPPDATTAALPTLDASYGLLPPDAPATAIVRYVDGPGDGLPAELHVEDRVEPTVVPRPRDGELRVSAGS